MTISLQDISVEDPVDVSEETAQHKFPQTLLSLTAAVIALQKDLTLTKLGKLTDKLLSLLNRNSIECILTLVGE